MSYLLAASMDRMKGALPFSKSIDDVADQMNRNTMCRMMIIWAVISTFTQLIGQNISCFGFTKYTKEFANEYCWTQGIYTHRLAYDTDQAPYPGIAPCVAVLDIEGGKIRFPCQEELMSADKIMHMWYQWVPFYFMVVAVAYYMPYLVLKTTKLRKIKPLISLLKDPNIIDGHPNRVAKKIASWIYNEVVYPRFALSTTTTAKFWCDFGLVIGLIMVKLLYFGVALGHMFVTAKMFKIGNWLTYGMLFTVSYSHKTSVKDVLFPKMAACRIVKWGATGLEPETGMCILAPNVTNQYLFLIMWYLNVTLIFLNALSWCYTLFKVLNPSLLHLWIVNSCMMQTTDDFTKMFQHIGPSGQIVVSKLSENMSGYILAMVSSKVNKKIEKFHKRNGDVGNNASNMDYVRVSSAPVGCNNHNTLITRDIG